MNYLTMSHLTKNAQKMLDEHSLVRWGDPEDYPSTINIEEIKDGAPGYALIITFLDPNNQDDKADWFIAEVHDRKELQEFSDLLDEDGIYYLIHRSWFEKIQQLNS